MRFISAKYKLVCFLVLIPLWISAQETIIKVSDNNSAKACEYASIMLSTMDNKYLDGGATDKNGEYRFSISELARFSVSSLGYKTQTGTINPGQKLSIELEPDLMNLETVVVTGQYKPQTLDKSIYRIDIIDARLMKQRGVSNLAEALSNETGIRLKVDPSLGTSIKMQGQSGENIKYLIDGIPISGRVGGIIDLSQINVENIDHIEIVKGPMAVQYGTSAIAGVINIITKTNKYFAQQIRANSYIDNKGNYNMGISGSVRKGYNSISFSGARNLFQGVDIDLNVDTTDSDGQDRYMEFKPKLVYNADLAYKFRKNDLQLGIKTHYMNTLLKNYSNYIEKVALAYDADYHTTRSINSFSLSDKLSDKLNYNMFFAYTYYGRGTDKITSDLYLLTKEITSTSSSSFHNISSRGTLSYNPINKKYSLIGGWDINLDYGSGDKLEKDSKIGDYAVFLSGQYSLGEILVLQPGIRLIYNTIYGAPIIPSINLQWIISESGNLRLSYAKGFRAPTLKELYLDFRDSNHDLSGNKDLKAETTNSYNISLDYTLSRDAYALTIEPELFFNDGKDAISLIVTNASSNSATNINLGGRRSFGAELNSSYNHASGFKIGAGFSRIGETYDEEGYGEYLPLVFYNNMSLNGKYHYARRNLTIVSSLKYYGKTPLLAPLPEDEGGAYYRVFAKAFSDLEISISKNLWKNKITLVLGAKNLLNNYEGITSGYLDYGQSDFQSQFIRPLNYGRTYFIKLNLNLNR